MPLPQGYERYDNWLHREAEKAWEESDDEECEDDDPEPEDSDDNTESEEE